MFGEGRLGYDGLDRPMVRTMTDRRNIDPQEWELRCDLAAAYRLFARFGMEDLIFTHLSVRLPAKAHPLLLNPFGHPFNHSPPSTLTPVDPSATATPRPAWRWRRRSRACCP